MFGLAAAAEPLIRLLLTEKWMFSVPYLRLACIAYAFIPVNSTNLQAIKALGRSDMFLRVEIVKKVLGIALVLVTMYHSVFAIAVSNVFINVIAIFINAYPNKILMKYGVKEQIKDISPYLIVSLLMAVIVYAVTFLHIGDVATLILQVFVGIASYSLMSYILGFEPFFMLIEAFKKITSNK